MLLFTLLLTWNKNERTHLSNDIETSPPKHAEKKNPQTLQENKKTRGEINNLTSQEIISNMLFARQRYYESG